MLNQQSDHTPIAGGRVLFAITFIHSAIEFSAWITILVVAFDQGGASTVGLAVAAQLIPAGLLAPVVTAAGDRFPRHIVLTSAFGAVALCSTGMALALALEVDFAFVLAMAAVLTIAMCAVPATVASLAVHRARTPLALMQWNVGRSFVRAAGSLIGPFATAIVLATTEPDPIFAVIGLLAAGTALVLGVRLPPDDRPPSSLRIRTIAKDSIAGIEYVATSRGPRKIVVYIGAIEMLIGSFDVIFVAVAFDQLDLGGGASALLTAAFAGGALLAAGFISRHLSWRLTTLVVIGSLLLTLPLMALGEPDRLTVVIVLVVVLGAGHALVEIGTQTLLQRTASDLMTSRAFGALDSATLVAAAVGAGLAGAFIDGKDLTAALVIVGAVAAGVLLVGAVGLRSAERAAAVDDDLVAALRSVSFLQTLPLPTVERLTRDVELRDVAAGQALITQGDAGHEFFILLEGAVDIDVDDVFVRHTSAPTSFGEIALLHDEPRSATVTATRPGRVAVIQRAGFLDAVTRTSTSHQGALDVAQQYRRPPDE